MNTPHARGARRPKRRTPFCVRARPRTSSEPPMHEVGAKYFSQIVLYSAVRTTLAMHGSSASERPEPRFEMAKVVPGATSYTSKPAACTFGAEMQNVCLGIVCDS